MAAIALLMAVLWISEAVPLAATALIPIVAFPLAGILNTGDTAKSYINSIIFLFIGGFLIALSMERWNLHRRIALNIIHVIGRRADFLVLGFMASSAFLSMDLQYRHLGYDAAHRVSNHLQDGGRFRERENAFASFDIDAGNRLWMLDRRCIHSGRNADESRVRKDIPRIVSGKPPIAFGQWILIGIPYSVTLLLVVWLLLTRVLLRVDNSLSLDNSVVEQELAKLGPITREEKTILSVFITTKLLWIFRKNSS